MESPSVKCPLTSAGGAGVRAKPPPLPTRVNKARSSGKAGAASPCFPPPTPTRLSCGLRFPLRLALTEAPFFAPPDAHGCGPVPVSECEDAANSITPSHLKRPHRNATMPVASKCSGYRRGRYLYNVCCVTYHSYVGLVSLRRRK